MLKFDFKRNMKLDWRNTAVPCEIFLQSVLKVKLMKGKMMVMMWMMMMMMMWMMLVIGEVSPKREMLPRLWLIDPVDHGADRTLCIKHYKLCFVQCTMKYTEIEYVHWLGNTSHSTKVNKTYCKIKCKNCTSSQDTRHNQRVFLRVVAVLAFYSWRFLSEYFAVLFSRREWGWKAGGRVMTWIGGWRGRPGMWR